MAVEERLRSKILYRGFIYCIKVMPILWAIIVFINNIVAYWGIHSEIVSAVAGVSLIPWTAILLASFVLRFCIYHRLYLYYVGVAECINWYDYKI